MGSNPTAPTIMKTIILKDNEVFATRKRIKNSKILEICKNEDVQDKLAYWKYVCLPEIRANLTEHQNLVKFAFFNSKLGTTLYSVYDTKDKLNHIKNIQVIITCTEKITLEKLNYFSYNVINGEVIEKE